LKLNSLFIDIVNTASRIETSSEKQKVQISEMTKQLLNADEWDIYERGIVQLKGKGLKNFESN
jgi:class 3 adenylate cyclase